MPCHIALVERMELSSQNALGLQFARFSTDSRNIVEQSVPETVTVVLKLLCVIQFEVDQ